MFRTLVLIAGVVLVAPFDAMADEVEGPRCVEVRKSAPYRGFGHHHIVTVRNTCDDDVRCRISTNVTPQTHSITVAAGEEDSVITRTGSPASVFEALVDCETQ
ncbi:MAG: hypothetical protein AB8H86_12495 [Polyangiales bacterium]